VDSICSRAVSNKCEYYYSSTLQPNGIFPTPAVAIFRSRGKTTVLSLLPLPRRMKTVIDAEGWYTRLNVFYFLFLLFRLPGLLLLALSWDAGLGPLLGYTYLA